MKNIRIGSYHWMQTTNGQLRFKEKIKLIQKIMVPSILSSIKKKIIIDFKLVTILI